MYLFLFSPIYFVNNACSGTTPCRPSTWHLYRDGMETETLPSLIKYTNCPPTKSCPTVCVPGKRSFPKNKMRRRSFISNAQVLPSAARRGTTTLLKSHSFPLKSSPLRVLIELFVCFLWMKIYRRSFGPDIKNAPTQGSLLNL